MTSPPSHRCGFTLMEVLVTMAIGSVLLFIAATLLGGAGDTYNRGSGSVSAEREARALLTQMSEDFAKAEWHPETIFTTEGEGWKKSRAGFLSLQPSDAQSEEGRIGDLCALQYYVKDIKVGDATVRCLMRGFRESAVVFPELRSGEFKSLFGEEVTDEPVAFGVLSFEITPLEKDPTTGRLSTWSKDPNQPVDMIRIRLVIARRELLGKLTTTRDWDSSEFRGDPKEAIHNRDLEVYEVIQRFGNDA